MRHPALSTVIMILAISQALAQPVYEPAKNYTTTNDTSIAQAAADMVSINGDTVYIDWTVVRREANGGGSSPLITAISKVLMAVRDKKWKPMSEKPGFTREGSPR